MLCIVRGESKATVRHAYNNEAVCIEQEQDRGSFMCCHFYSGKIHAPVQPSCVDKPNVNFFLLICCWRYIHVP